MNCRESCFLQYLQCGNLLLEAPSVQISTQQSITKVPWKQARRKWGKKKHKVSSLGAKQTLKMGSQNRFKIDENHVPDHFETILLLPGAPTPNDNREELKGAGGRGRSPSD